MVVSKPAGITVNRADTTKDEVTVQDEAEKYLNFQFQISNLPAGKAGFKFPKPKYGEEGWTPEQGFYERGGIVHRLDKETSGVLVLAKNPKTYVSLQQQFRERTVKKVYQALAHGLVAPAEGEISVPVGRLPWNTKQFGIVPGGKESKTLYKVLHTYQNPQTKEKLSLVELYPQSGRTHQIRVHLKYIGHPIFADFLYAGRKTSRTDRKILERVFLHASQLSFVHPTTGEMVTFVSQLPEELQKTLTAFVQLPK